jgi:hypothetical protein
MELFLLLEKNGLHVLSLAMEVEFDDKELTQILLEYTLIFLQAQNDNQPFAV